MQKGEGRCLEKIKWEERDDDDDDDDDEDDDDDDDGGDFGDFRPVLCFSAKRKKRPFAMMAMTLVQWRLFLGKKKMMIMIMNMNITMMTVTVMIIIITRITMIFN